MPKLFFRDIKGKKFGSLTVVEIDGKQSLQLPYDETDISKSIAVTCTCSCGTRYTLPYSKLLHDGVTSCGCEQKVVHVRRISKRNSTGVTGVSLSSKSGKYKACITVNKVTKWLGTFDTLEEATTARRAAEKAYGLVDPE